MPKTLEKLRGTSYGYSFASPQLIFETLKMTYQNLTRTHLLRRKTVEAQTGIARSTIYKLISLGEFPAPIKLTTNGAVAWKSNEIEQWINDRIIQSPPWISPRRTSTRSQSDPTIQENKSNKNNHKETLTQHFLTSLSAKTISDLISAREAKHD